LASVLLKDEDIQFEGLFDKQPWDQYFLSRMEDIEGNRERDALLLFSHS
jgi:CTD kinase subunit beta